MNSGAACGACGLSVIRISAFADPSQLLPRGLTLTCGGGSGADGLLTVPIQTSSKLRDRCAKKGSLDGVRLGEADVFGDDHASRAPLALPDAPAATIEGKLWGQHAQELWEHPHSEATVVILGVLPTSVGEDAALAGVAMEVDVHAQTRSSLIPEDQALEPEDGAMQGLARLSPLPVQVHPGQATAVVPADHAVWIQHRHNLPDEVIPEDLCIRSRGKKETNETVHEPASIALSGMHPRADHHSLLVPSCDRPVRDLEEIASDIAQCAAEALQLTEAPGHGIARDCREAVPQHRVGVRRGHCEEDSVPLLLPERVLEGQGVAATGDAVTVSAGTVIPHTLAHGLPELRRCACPETLRLGLASLRRSGRRGLGSSLGRARLRPSNRPHA
mmetsp:Transcript_4778/g.10642  ORF Transcript_4778/g.10642 Transcript_4778/m.10642 type:complete len:388 (-) Transcript_4778:49-1212(-)